MRDVENKEFWVKSIKHSVIKRMVDRGYTDAVKISNVVDLEIEEVKKIIELKKSYIYFLDKKLRFDCLMYYSYDLYNNSLKKKVLDFSPEYFLEFTGGKGSIFRVWNESGSEFEEIQNGCDLAHNLALLKLIELKYSSEDIVKILGSDEVKKFKKNYSLGTDSLSYRISIHSKNKGIRYKQYEFLFNLLAFENNLDNASKIVGLTQNDIDEFIENNSMFKSNDESKILDKNKVFDEFFQWKIEILIEIFTFKTVYNEDLIEFPKIFEIDENIIKKIDDSCKCKLDLYDMLEEISHRLSQLNLDVEEINEIIALDRLHLSNEYYMDKWIENLKEECDVYGN